MFSPGLYLWLIPLLPLVASAVTAALGPTMLRQRSHWPCILAAGASCVLSLLLLNAVRNGYLNHVDYGTWFGAGDIHASVRAGYDLQADGLTAIMLVMITFISSLIAIYSIGYMHNDPGYARFFAEFSLFIAFMTGLVMANNFVLLYACWEGVGLCSYLLIGFWYTRPAAAAAARKAFLVTRLGDVGLFIGILLMWSYFGHNVGALDYDKVFLQVANRLKPDNPHPLDLNIIEAICLLLLCGAVGKSAQFPLHVWLPDAMEGPTPVSALIHAATMVTAGVYLVARCTPLFALAPTAQATVAILGAITALLAALIALTQTDLKRVLAYSTLSQLGYMFLGLGCGLKDQGLTTFAVFAAIFHLFTHAFFKALLFLGAGSVMHAMGDVIDMRKFGGLRKVLPTTHWTFFCGAFALAGIPPLAGFWSKDEIIAVTWLAGEHSGLYAVLFAVALVTAGLTAFYTSRAYFMTFWGPERIPPEAHHHGHGEVHESPPVMTLPLMILAAGAVLVGVLLGPTHLFEDLLEKRWMEPIFPESIKQTADHAGNPLLLMVTLLFAVGGVLLAWWMYVRAPQSADRLAQRAPVAYDFSRNRFYIDEIYNIFVVAPLNALAHVLRVIDQYFIDGLVDLIGQVPGLLAYAVRPIQNGLVQFYALLMVLGMTSIIVAVLLR
jgi:NADH-quinone oxidoreductase subunit L